MDYPAPATELVVQVGHAVVMVQELLSGRKIDRLDHRSLDQVLQLNELQAGRLSGSPDIPAVDLHLHDDGAGYCLHAPLREHNRRSAALERWIAAVGADSRPRLAGADAVHMDLHTGNMLAGGGVITGVVDWDGAAQATDPEVTQRLDAVLDSLPEDTLRPIWAHMSLRMVDWAIRHFTPGDVEHWLDLAEQRVS